MIRDARILVTGGTGSFGKAFTTRLLKEHDPRRVILFADGEEGMRVAREQFKGYGERVDYFLGNVRDLDRCRRAFRGCDIVVHAAAMKQVPECETAPFEAVRTNIGGTQNVCEAALDNQVSKVVFISTDKAPSPQTLYGTTKLAAERIVQGAGVYSGGHSAFCCVRYGNVAGSRGSVIPYWRSLLANGLTTLPITDSRMTRFWLTLDEAVSIVINAIENGWPGEILIPKMPSFKLTDLACALVGNDLKQRVDALTSAGFTRLVASDVKPAWEQVGIRPGEKLHEAMLGEYEWMQTMNAGDYYVVNGNSGVLVQEGFRYSTDANSWWLSVDDIRKRLEAV